MKTETRKHFKLSEHNKISEFVDYSYCSIEMTILALNIPIGRIVIQQPRLLPNDWEKAKLSKKKKQKKKINI
jgi:hypothetical protein